jgi:predicted transcriptional regulator
LLFIDTLCQTATQQSAVFSISSYSNDLNIDFSDFAERGEQPLHVFYLLWLDTVNHSYKTASSIFDCIKAKEDNQAFHKLCGP